MLHLTTTLKRAAQPLVVAIIALASTDPLAIPHRSSPSVNPPSNGVGARTPSAATPLPSMYWQSAFDQPTTAVMFIPMASPQAVSALSVPMPDPDTFNTEDTLDNPSLFDLGDQGPNNEWERVAPPKALPSVRPGFATIALETRTGPDGLPVPVPLPQGPKVKPKNWRVAMISNAKKYLGIRYVWGGNSPEQGMDCSGFTRWVTAMTLGKALPRLASQQSEVGTEVPKEDLQPGDLVFFDTKRGPATHVGIYVGHGLFINAPHTGASIRFESLASDYWEARWHGARRIG